MADAEHPEQPPPRFRFVAVGPWKGLSEAEIMAKLAEEGAAWSDAGEDSGGVEG